MSYILPFFIGCSIVFASIVNGHVAGRVGMTRGIQMNYFIGSLAALVLTGFSKIVSHGTLSIETIPVVFILGSFFGLGVSFFMNKIVPEISAFYIVLLPFVGQMLVSGCIDFFYLNILSKGKVIGVALILLGIVCNAILERTSVTL